MALTMFSYIRMLNTCNAGDGKQRWHETKVFRRIRLSIKWPALRWHLGGRKSRSWSKASVTGNVPTGTVCEKVWFSKMARCILLNHTHHICKGVWFTESYHLIKLKGTLYCFAHDGWNYGYSPGNRFFFLKEGRIYEGFDSVRCIFLLNHIFW